MSEPLREGLARHGLLADKRLGQHFLLDLNLTRKIAGLTGELAGAEVLEVGPGPGGLTRALLEGGAARVIAVEKDARFLPMLEELRAASGGRLEILPGDALAARAEDRFEGPFRVVANLPYNVATPLLTGWLKRSPPPAAMALMFQKEVAERIAAAPGSPAYGRLAVIAQAVCEARVGLTLRARAFTPPPRVDSAVVVLVPRPDRPEPSLIAALERVTAAAFGQRRKMLRSSLRALGGESLLARAGVAPDLRAEALDVAQFLALARESLAPA